MDGDYDIRGMWSDQVVRELERRRYATVFGSSSRGSDDAEIDYWSGVSTVVAESGWGLLSGGYGGTMSCLSEKHIQDGGHAVGIVCAAVSDDTPRQCYSDIVSVSAPFERLEALLRLGSAYLVLPGGIGTQVELASAIWLQDRGFISQRPTLLLGCDWSDWADWFATIPGGLRGRRSLRQVVKHVTDLDHFKREWALIARASGDD